MSLSSSASRRSLLALPLLAAATKLTTPLSALAAKEPAKMGEMPSTGGLRPGPMGLDSTPFAIQGVEPLAIKIEKAQVDSQVEIQEIVDGVMMNPSGPFIVSWYRETGKLGALDNCVMAGHLDYWDVGPAVFYHLGDAAEGDSIKITGVDDVVYNYKISWSKLYTVDELDAATVRRIVGRTKDERLTLITCGGTFDYNAGVYLQRRVVRASRDHKQPTG